MMAKEKVLKARGEEVPPDEARKRFWEKQGQRVIRALKKKGYDAEFFQTAEEVAKRIIEVASSAKEVGVGGSVTMRELKVMDVLREQGKNVHDHWIKPPPDDPANMRVRMAHLVCDLFLTSTNAITLKGELVNIDGGGNRTNAMTFGPKKVVVVAGVNKIVRDIDEGIRRIHEVAAPLRALQSGFPTPCGETGFCSPHKPGLHICCITSILERKPLSTDISIYLVGEVLGF